MEITLKNKIFKLHQTGLFVSMDGEVFMDIKSRKFPNGNFTYGSVNNSNGYRVVKYKGKLFLVHRLVAECFIPNPNNYPTVDHIDRNKENNNVTNLRWATMSMQNYNKDTSKLKNRDDLSKKVLQYTLDGELVNEWPSTNECHRNGFYSSNVCNCCNGKLKHYKGYVWKYKN